MFEMKTNIQIRFLNEMKFLNGEIRLDLLINISCNFHSLIDK